MNELCALMAHFGKAPIKTRVNGEEIHGSRAQFRVGGGGANGVRETWEAVVKLPDSPALPTPLTKVEFKVSYFEVSASRDDLDQFQEAEIELRPKHRVERRTIAASSTTLGGLDDDRIRVSEVLFNTFPRNPETGVSTQAGNAFCPSSTSTSMATTRRSTATCPTLSISRNPESQRPKGCRMGGTGTTITVSGTGDRGALFDVVWERLLSVIDEHIAGDYPAVNGYLSEAVFTAEDRGAWGAKGDELWFTFFDMSGCCSRSSDAWAHFTTLAIGLHWQGLEALAAEHGFTITSERPSLADERAKSRLVRLREDLWSASDDGVHGDDQCIKLDDLDDREKARAARALEECQCVMCMLLPEESTTNPPTTDATKAIK